MQKFFRIWFRGGIGSGVLELTPAGFCVFLSDTESKICDKPDPDQASFFHFGCGRSLCDYILGIIMCKLQLDR